MGIAQHWTTNYESVIDSDQKRKNIWLNFEFIILN